ncbi:hypothetical protein AM500_18800 [Bacillus sp. FJAT-18017]|nr:hypothetical protein AM500_18800 [Bacillus sp. FJAT-18017]
MKVLIADDEMQVRMGLRMKIDWEAEGFEIVAEASNGKEAIEVLETRNINLVITDMRMPIMDGLELARRCYEEFSDVKVIVLSGYSDFEYVRGSMKKGVRDYLLKPVAPDELEVTLRNIHKEVMEEKKRQAKEAKFKHLAISQFQEVQEQYLLYLAKERWLDPAIVIERLNQLHLDELTKENIRFTILTVEIRARDAHTNRVKELWHPFQLMCKEISSLKNGVYTFHDPSYAQMIHFLVIKDNENENETLSNMVQSIQQNVNRLLQLETVIGIGNTVKGVANLKNGYITSLLAWSRSELGSGSQIIDVSNMQEDDFDFSADMEKKLMKAVETAQLALFKEHIDTLLNSNKNQSIIGFSFLSNRILFLLGSVVRKYDVETQTVQKLMWTCQQNIWALNSYQEVIDELKEIAQLIIEKVRAARFSNGKLIIESVRQYIDKHYADEISLTLLAEMFHINSAYLSETFKNHVGQNFSDYLVNIRIEKAKRFLMDKDLKIIDVANLVGYSNSGYFSTVFKKQLKQTPLEYRQSNGKDRKDIN